MTAGGPDRSVRAARGTSAARILAHLQRGLLAVVIAFGCDGGDPTGPPPIQLPAGAVVPTQPVGTLPGALSADVDGNAVWTMPIVVPPGRAGMQPELSLAYSSGAGSGLLGVGFAIHGLESKIARCTHALEADGLRVVQFDDRDRLCLDGEPLLLIEDGHDYWQDGSQYTTESESTTRVTVVGVGPDGPSTFRVERPDARIATYAVPVRPERVSYEALDGRRPTISGAPNVRWALRRLEDRHGNAMELDYETRYPRAEDGEPIFTQRVRRITYTRWGSSAGRRRVELVYEPRPDARDVSVAGIRERVDSRIAALEMHAPDIDGATHLAWSYRFTYDGGSITRRSRLASVQRCDAYAACLPPTVFTWSNGSFDYDEVALGRRAGLLSTQLADVDGDGLDDLVVRDADGVANVWRRDGAGFGDRVATTGVLATAPIVADLTGDGRAELVGGETRSMCVTDADCDGGHCARFPEGGGSGYCAPSCRCLGNNGLPFELPPARDVCPSSASTCSDPGAICGDLDADDVAECISTADLEGEGWRVYRFIGGTGSGVATGELVTGHTALPGHGAITFANLDGDGAPDLLRRDGDAFWSFGANTWDATRIFEAPSDPSEPVEQVFFDPRPSLDIPVDEHRYRGIVQILDLDRDGRDDVLIPFPPEGSERIGRYHLTSIDGSDTLTNLAVSYRDQLWIDVDGDGLVDAVDLANRVNAILSPPGESRLRVRRNSGNGFGPPRRAIGPGEYFPFWPQEAYEPGTPREVGATWESEWWNVDLRVRALDYDQDGRQDFLMLGPTPRIYVSRGTSFEARPLPFDFVDGPVEVAFPGSEYTTNRRPPFLVGDINGDGQPDFVHGEELTAHVSTGGRADLLREVVDGLGARDQVLYAALSDPQVYDDALDYGPTDARCGYPIACAGRRRSVVAQIHRENPTHPDRRERYRYAGGRRDARTGASLGFIRVYSEVDFGRRTETWFEPAYEVVPEGASMRAGYHPLARRPVRSYTVELAGEDVLVVRTDFHYRGDDVSGPGEAHGFAPRIERGLRFRIEDVVTRHYVDAWDDWEGASYPGGVPCPECDVSDKFFRMRARFVDAWRTDRENYQYDDRYRCEVTSEETGGAACELELGEGRRFPLPGAIATMTYRVDVGDSGEIDWAGLRELDGDVEILERTVFERRDDEATWLIGLPVAIEAERCERPDGFSRDRIRCSPVAEEPDVARRLTQVEYDADQPSRIVREPRAPVFDEAGNPTGLQQITVVEYRRGNPVETRVELPTGEVRRREIEYDSLENVFPTEVRDHLLTRVLTQRQLWQPDLGVIVVSQAPNGAETHHRYDGVGRPRGVRAPGAAWVDQGYEPTSSGVGLQVTRTGAAVVDQAAATDVRGRPVASEHEPFDGTTWIRSTIGYDTLGNAARVTLPRVGGAGAPAFEGLYDGVSRLRETRFDDGTGASLAGRFDYRVEFTGDTRRPWAVVTEAEDPAGNRRSVQHDLRGQLIRGHELFVPETGPAESVDATFEYDLHGVQSTVRTPEGAVRSVVESDRLGRALRVVDSERGELELRYDGFDQVVFTRDAEGQETTFVYDELGRALARTTSGEPPTLWQWDSALNGAGQLDFEASPDGHVVSFEYDVHGRLTRQLDDVGAIDRTYDAEGRLSRVLYPGASGSRFTVEYQWRGGYLERIVDVTGGGSSTIWTAEERHPDGRVRVERAGASGAESTRTYDDRTGRLSSLIVVSGHTETLAQVRAIYGPNGELTSREDGVLGRLERFESDSLGRLRGWSYETPTGTGELGYEYGLTGNLEVVRDRVSGAPIDTLAYEQIRNAGPHAPTLFDGQDLAYDRLGRQTYGIDGRTVEYTPFDLPRRITSLGTEVEYRYDAEGERVEAVTLENGRLTRRVRYVGGLYERHERADGVVEHHHYVAGPEGVVAQVITDNLASPTKQLHYHRDGLGSVVLVTDEHGELVERQWFSPFGRRLRDDGSFADPTTAAASDVGRGFTGHEHDDGLGLVNMRGRVYDPRLRRFLTPDPIVGAMASAQSWNGYSYVGNRPLDLVDPTGLQSRPPDRTVEGEGYTLDIWRTGIDFVDHQLDRAMGREPPVSTGASPSGGAPPSLAEAITRGTVMGILESTVGQLPETPRILGQPGGSFNPLYVGYRALRAGFMDAVADSGPGAYPGQSLLEGRSELIQIVADMSPGTLVAVGRDVLGVVNLLREGIRVATSGDAFDIWRFIGRLIPYVVVAILTFRYAPRMAATRSTGTITSRPSATVPPGTTRLYRAVGPEEFEELVRTGRFEAGPNSLEGKFFAETPEHAGAWGDAMMGPGNYRIVTADVPTGVASQFMRWPRLDGIGPAVYAELNQLGDVVVGVFR